MVGDGGSQEHIFPLHSHLMKDGEHGAVTGVRKHGERETAEEVSDARVHRRVRYSACSTTYLYDLERDNH